MPRLDRRPASSANLSDPLPARHESGRGVSAAFDLVVVGAGPGGLAAAATAAESGLRVCLVDDNPAAGGQIWRARAGDGPSKAAARWLRRMPIARVEVR